MAKSKVEVPRRVAGVKVPKASRKTGKSVARLLDSPLGRQVLADALIAAASAAAAALVRRRPDEVGAAGAAVADAGAGAAMTAKDVAQAAAGAVGGVVAEVARQALSPSRDDRAAEGGYAVLAAEGKARKAKGKDKPSRH